MLSQCSVERDAAQTAREEPGPLAPTKGTFQAKRQERLETTHEHRNDIIPGFTLYLEAPFATATCRRAAQVVLFTPARLWTQLPFP